MCNEFFYLFYWLFFTQGFAYNGDEKSAALQINVKNIATLNLQQDESYQLSVSPKAITINANTDSGAIYALETLLQSLQNTNSEYFFPALSVTDNPRFKWRGLMIDAARHFQPVDVIKRNLDAMAAVKLNVFHWHLVDDQGWRIEMKNLKQLHEKASDGQYYSQEQIKDVVKYANNLGIMVMPEIDVPGHASAILTAIPEIGSTVGKSYSIERNAGVFTPTLDPTNPKTYQILSQIFDEVCPLFPGKYFHIGGGENEGKEWDANPKIQQFKKENNLKTNHDLQTYFTLKLNLMLKKNNKILMGWEEIMTKDMSKDAIIHAWREGSDDSKTGGSVVKAAENGYQTVLSNGFYIDLLLGVNHHYETDPINSKLNLSPSIQKNILGGEATMWSELVSPLTIDSRIWPRTAAIAERLWSEATVNNLENLYKRLTPVSNRLEELGISHIKNKEQILRNISNYQDTQALEDFSNICEPLKYYSRNKGGTEYQSYSPLTLFADACTPDAKDALLFNQYVKKYSENPSDTVSKKTIIDFLNKCISTYENLKKLEERLKNTRLIHYWICCGFMK
jgi:hexosaminidase